MTHTYICSLLSFFKKITFSYKNWEDYDMLINNFLLFLYTINILLVIHIGTK